MKIIMINHTFQKKEFYKRWQLLAEKHKDLDVTLLAPKEWTWGAGKTLTFGKKEVIKGNALDDDNFHLRLIRTKQRKFLKWSFDWSSKDMINEIKKTKPDIVYFIGLHNQYAIQQLIKYKKTKMPSMKLLVFSMRGKYHSIQINKTKTNLLHWIARRVLYFSSKKKLALFNKNVDAVFCHYPDGFNEFRKEGFNGPIYMQTQVGVDTDIFHKDSMAREKIRKKYNIGDSYLFGSASRFNASKGISEIIQALPDTGNWKYLLMGSGLPEEVERIKKEIQKRNFEDKIILTGYIDNWKDMAEHWNALDCAVHTPLTTKEWEETFSLALVQAMATEKPVIGSSSGSVPYQIGPNGIIVPEKDINALRTAMCDMMNNPKKGLIIGSEMRNRAYKCFDIKQLNELFYLTLLDIMKGKYDVSKVDMTTYFDTRVED